MTEVITASDDGDNVADEVNPEEDELLVEDLPAEELPAVEPLVEELRRANIPLANNARSFLQRRIPIRYAISDNRDRGSRNLPEPKHLLIGLPEAFQLFGGVWVAQKGEEVFIDFFARNDQDDRKGHRVGDPWRWIKIKANSEIAMGISRPYTKSRSDGELVRDYNIGAFKIVVPLFLGAEASEPVAEDQPIPRRLFS